MHAIYVCEHNYIVQRCKCIGPHNRVVVPCTARCDGVYDENIRWEPAKED